MPACRCGVVTAKEEWCAQCARFRRKPTPVTAVQWRPGLVVEGVKPKEAIIHLSDDHKWYYVTKDNLHTHYWLEVTPRAGALSEAQRNSRGFLEPSWAEFRLKDGTVYHRQALPFQYWKINARHRNQQETTPDSELFIDYAVLHNWDHDRATGPSTTAVIELGEDFDILRDGDWIVTTETGTREVWSDAKFRAAYEIAGEV
jgi:hypothetical protein